MAPRGCWSDGRARNLLTGLMLALVMVEALQRLTLVEVANSPTHLRSP